MDAKTTALGIADAIADVEATALEIGGNIVIGEKLAVLHKRLRAGLYQHGDALGLSTDDIAEIDNHGPQRRGGGPKEEFPEN